MNLAAGMVVMLIIQCKKGEYICLYDYWEAQNISPEKPKDAAGSKTGKCSSILVDETLNLLHQDDPLLIDILRKEYLMPPSDFPYHFSSTNSNVDGQF